MTPAPAGFRGIFRGGHAALAGYRLGLSGPTDG